MARRVGCGQRWSATVDRRRPPLTTVDRRLTNGDGTVKMPHGTTQVVTRGASNHCGGWTNQRVTRGTGVCQSEVL
ncbi:hypothetical protein Tco_0216019 [Tanacetum coccineum]